MIVSQTRETPAKVFVEKMIVSQTRETLAKVFFEKMIVSQTREPPTEIFFAGLWHIYLPKWKAKNFGGSVTQSVFQRNISQGVRGSMTHLFFKVQSKKNFRGGFAGLWHNHFSKKNILREFRGSMTHWFFKVQSQKNFAGVSRVYHKLKNIFVRFRGGFAGGSRPSVKNWNFLALWKTRQY